MSSRNWKFRLEDINDALDKISKYIAGLDQDDWMKDQKTIDAVIRNLEIIGEAATHVPENIQEQLTDIPWYQMKGMRNVLVHEYFGTDNEVLWKTLQEDLPPLKLKIQKFLIKTH